MMSDKPRFSLGSKILYGVLVILILLMFWPSSRAFLQQGLMKIGLFKPKVEQKAEPQEDDARQLEESTLTEKAAFTGIDNKLVQTEDLGGKVVFINFWATWCGPCIAEMPSIQKLHDQFKGNDAVEFILVEIDGDMGAAQAFMKEHKLDMPVYVPAGNIPGEWLAGAIPSTVVLDKSGKRVFKHEGMADYSDAGFADFIKKLASE